MLAARDLTKRFGARTVVDGLSFEVKRGEIFGFLGPNGAGKTTSLRMLVGLVRPTSGHVELFGQKLEPRTRALLGRVGAIIDSPSLYREFTGWQNLELFAAMSGGATKARLDQVVARVGLATRIRDRVGTYSHGMKQRLAIAAALLPKPDLIFLDEPTNGLDPIGIRELRTLIRSLRDDDGLTVLVSSHLLVEIEQLCERAVVIADGRARWEGRVADLLAARRRVRVRATPAAQAHEVVARFGPVTAHGDLLELEPPASGEDLVPALTRALVQAQVQVHEIALWAPSLEDVFVELIGADGTAEGRT